MIYFYTWSTPNTRKISISLEEMQLPYEIKLIVLKEQQQKQPDYLKINPNGRVPAIIDRDNNDFAVFESGAILIYLAEKSGLFLPSDVQGRSTVMQWLMWQMGGLGPMQGQANVFYRYFPEKLPSVISRYQNETRRLYQVMDTRLANEDYLAGAYSVADMACYPWVAQHEWAGIDLEEFSNLTRWFDAVGERPAVKVGMTVPEPQRPPDKMLETANRVLVM
ncbi:MAG: glutathione S-transferase family protein [Rhodospirillaceae bacterium]|nr:glutathione S-transferase family protein [Rhodospirillaceae bacterium]